MGLFSLFKSDVINEITSVNAQLSLLISEFMKAKGFYTQKAGSFNQFLTYSSSQKKAQWPALRKKFRSLTLMGLKEERLEEALTKRTLKRVESIIRLRLDPQDLVDYTEIDKELRILFQDVLFWRKVCLEEISFLDNSKSRVFDEHEYVLRHLGSLLKQEQEIIFKHHSLSSGPGGEVEELNLLTKRVHKVLESWRPDFINQLSIKEIIDPKDPDLLALYNEVFKVCFPNEGDLDDFDYFTDCLSDVNPNKNKYSKYHILVVRNHAGKIVAGCTFWFFCAGKKHDICFGWGEYIGVIPEYRRFSIGTMLAARKLMMLNRDAKAVGHRNIHAIFGEYFDQTKMTRKEVKSDHMHPADRVRFHSSYGMRGLKGYDHNIPGDDSRTFDRLYQLGFWSHLKAFQHAVPSGWLVGVLETLFTSPYYDISSNHNILRHIRAWASRHPSVELEPLH